MNEQIALDEEIVKWLITGMTSSRRNLQYSPNRLFRLLQFSAIDKLINEMLFNLVSEGHGLPSLLPSSTTTTYIKNKALLKRQNEVVGC
ncbi:hypothetical protein L6452_37648 [Arctium lappa]|uniref:Uncharacterized protein n=1 Tax=Arctium lappa TaxID=4217 RepID=A0ACB8Y4N1_ARCLA|nr:hypothetical protein L6452_37648 [Arctium lappa]